MKTKRKVTKERECMKKKNKSLQKVLIYSYSYLLLMITFFQKYDSRKYALDSTLIVRESLDYRFRFK